MNDALCLNCGLLIPHHPDAHITMRFLPGPDDSFDYVVAVNDIEVHRCPGPNQPSTPRPKPAPQ